MAIRQTSILVQIWGNFMFKVATRILTEILLECHPILFLPKMKMADNAIIRIEKIKKLVLKLDGHPLKKVNMQLDTSIR